ncbi:MAG: carboxypeptidase regulatory-like domain-containing protein [Acidobacteriota bacterium]|nr:carboxypeptidase regulatory-like domain-containing protein [Acidobacteriota bacterium]
MSFKTLVRRWIPLAVVILLLGSLALGQGVTGTVSGVVKDPSGAVIPNAKVELQCAAIGLTRTGQANDTGNFVFVNLPPATYSITVQAEGFKKIEMTGVILNATDRVSLPVIMQIGTTTTEVTVAADAGQVQLQAESGERSDLITNKQLNDVAMNGSNVLDYMKLIPGVISSFDGHQSGTGGLDSMNINGSRGNQHEFTIDGASNVDTGNNGGTHVTINTDAIAEVKVLTSNYQAEFGKAAGGQIAIVSKGGTNQWHGGATFSHRHEGLNANTWLNDHNGIKDKAIYRYNFIGYNVGGPIIKDKLFFFWSQEYYRQVVPLGTETAYVPTEKERDGDFTASTDGNGLPVQIGGTGVSGNKVVAINTQMQKILNLFPTPNVSGYGVGGQNYNWISSLSIHNPRREDIVRVDYQVNSANRLFVRYIYNSENDKSPYTSSGPVGSYTCESSVNFPGGCYQKHPGWNLSANLVTMIRPNLLNEFSIGPSHTSSDAGGVNNNSSRGANGITLPLLYTLGDDQSIPDLSFGGLNNTNFTSSYLGATPWFQHNTTINVNDNLTLSLHNHTLKAGFFFQRNRKDQIAWGNINGQFSFSNAQTSPTSCDGTLYACGNPIASALLGNFISFSQSSARPVGRFRYSQAEFFLQDTWKATPRLTLDYGMRFAWIPPATDANNQIALFNPQAYNPAEAVSIDPSTGEAINGTGDLLNGMQYTKSNTLPVGGWNSRGIMPEPRIGFAYDLLGDHTTILRGGFGLMHDRIQGNLIYNTVFSNPAIVVTPTLGAGNVSSLPSMSTSSSESPVLGNITGAAQNGKIPTVYQYSLGIQRELFKGTTLDVAYVGNVARHLVTQKDLNAVPYDAAFMASNQDPSCSLWGGGGTPSVQPGLQSEYAAAGFKYNGWCALGRNNYVDTPLAPYHGYATAGGTQGIRYYDFDGTSNYNSLQASLQRRFSKGLTFGLAYTWSKSLGTAAGDQDVQDPVNAKVDYRAMSWDRKHVFTANYVYDIPNLSKHIREPKWLAYVTDGFQFSGVTQFMTGNPLDTSNSWSFPSGAFTGGNNWASIPYYYSFDKSGNLREPAIGAPGRATRDMFRSPNMQNWDMSLFKNIKATERVNLQLRAEMFNAFNHPNFTNKYITSVSVNGPWPWNSANTPITYSKNSNWGQVDNTSQIANGPGSPRVVQLGAKVIF